MTNLVSLLSYTKTHTHTHTHIYIYIHTVLSPYPRVIRSKTYCGYVKPQIIPNAIYNVNVQTVPGAHPASCTMGTGSFPGVKRPGRGADHPPRSCVEVENE
jgi:hypothetical protein